MSGLKELKRRIGTVKNTQQTTRAMEMVSAAKLRRATQAIKSQRKFAQGIHELIGTLSQVDGVRVDERLVTLRKDDSLKTLVVVVTSDRGLCGSFNAQAIKAAEAELKKGEEAGRRVELFCIGRRGRDYFKRRIPEQIVKHQEFGARVDFDEAKALTKELLDMYLEEGAYDRIVVIFNEFKNAITQEVRTTQLLPISPADAGVETESETRVEGERYITSPEPSELLMRLMEKHFSAQTLRYLLESQASEHGARMSAMSNATKNAGEMIHKLSLIYNKQRQAGITKEILEIVSGSEALKA